MKRCVVYQMFGPSYRLQTALSLYSLRRFYDGPVVLLTDAAELKEAFGKECTIEPIAVETGTPWYTQKPAMLAKKLADSCVYFDCDTMIDAPIDPLFPDKDDERPLFTQCSNWTAKSQQASFRLLAAADRGFLHPSWMEAAIEADLPSVNTGIYAWSKSCKIGPEWYELTKAMPFLADEQVVNLMLPQWKHQVYDDRWNHSPQLARPLPNEKVFVWHYTTGYIGRAKSLYYRVLGEALDANFCGVADWYGKDQRFIRERK